MPEGSPRPLIPGQEQTSAPSALRLSAGDDVAVALRDLEAGTTLDADCAGVVVREAVPRGHKVALRALRAGEPVRKLGEVVGVATTAIAEGQWVHQHNLEGTVPSLPPLASPASPPAAPARGPGQATFDGIVRQDGRVGTRNYLAVLTTVNCSATAARLICRRVTDSGLLAGHPGVDGVVALTHGSGCGTDTGGDGLSLLRRTLSGYARHPNVAGVLVLGLGCEVNQAHELVETWPPDETAPAEVMTIQEQGGTRATVEEGLSRLAAMLPAAASVRRTPVEASHLVLGLECGGSDAFSAITANPSLGAAADLVVAHGGTAILGETPEICGAEHLLARRAVTPAVADALQERIHWWRSYTSAHGASVGDNPSPGNKAGGLTTIAEKSLGAVAKGGTSPLVAVYRYGDKVDRPGLVFMDTPGYDPVSVTGMVAGGANVVCFTTGRGSVFGSKPVPCLKLASTSDLYRRMEEDMDLDCGAVLEGGVSLAEMGRRIFEAVLATASGRRTKSEMLGLGDEEFVPWQVGAVL